MEDLFNDIVPFSSSVIGVGALLIASFSSIFSVANPVAAMPVFMSLTEDNTDEERARTALKASVYMFLVLLVFLLAGTYILSFFGLSLPGMRIAGGLIILRAGYSMLNPDQSGRKLSKEEADAAREKNDISFSPLAMPLLSGPGSIAVVIGLGSQVRNGFDYIVITMAIFMTALIAYGLLRVSPRLVKYIGRSGMSVMTRMMGFIALCIGVQFIINGIAKFYGIG